MKKKICGLFGHKWSKKWLWVDIRDYAAKQCGRCGRIKWGATLEYGRTFGKGMFDGKYEIITRRET